MALSNDKLAAYPHYKTFSCHDAELFANDHSELFGEHSQLHTVEFGDGNLNLVFRVKNQFGTSLIVKQALPYARCVGESWPLTLDRARIEAEVLLQHRQQVPDHTVDVVYYDPAKAAMVLEDLADHQILRQALIAGKQLPLLAEHVALYLSHTAFFSSDFVLDGPSKKAQVARFLNPELCLITEDLCFTDPFCNHERNSFDAALQPFVRSLWFDDELKAQVASLKASFLSKPQALLHGDVHTGSIFVRHDSTKLIDAEFGFYGPIGFDVGSFIGNLLLNYFSVPGHLTDSGRAREQHAYLRAQLSRFEHCFNQHWLELMRLHTKDSALQNERYQQHFLQQVWQDALGFAGCELIRRIVGLAHVADMDKISNKHLKNQCELRALEFGRLLILQHRQASGLSQVLAQLPL